MKKSLFLIPLVSVALYSCDSKDGSVNNGEDNFDTSYITVRLVSASETGSRADGDSYSPDNNINNGEYANGTESENKVNLVRFYFFNEGGQPAYVKNMQTGAKQSFYDYNPDAEGSQGTSGGDLQQTVEKIVNATIVINTEAGDDLPYSMMAILNPTTDLQKTGTGENDGLSVQELNKLVEDYKTGLVSNNFVMSNSIYAAVPPMQTNLQVMEDVEVGKHIYTTIEAAKADPVVMYVERVVAKLTLDVALDNVGTAANPIYATQSKNQDDQPVFVKFLGWNVTGTPDVSRLMKLINPGWKPGATFFGIENMPWNSSDFHRSFWAINPENYELQFGSFYTKSNENAEKSGWNFDNNHYPAMGITGYGSDYAIYPQEHAADNEDGSGPDYPSKVIIAAQLCDNMGNAMPLAEWGGVKYTIEGLKTALARMVNLFYRINNTGEWIPLTGNNLYFVTESTIDNATTNSGHPINSEDNPRYHVYAQVDKESLGYKEGDVVVFQIGNGDNQTPENVYNSFTAVNEYIITRTNKAQVWNDGYTYYYFDIKHLGDSNGSVGVVRNHWYQATINTLNGLGTPVFDPNEVIYPEKPESETSFIAAQVRILSWRIVKDAVDLAW